MLLIIMKCVSRLSVMFSCALKFAETTGQLTTEASQQAGGSNFGTSGNTVLQWLLYSILIPALVAAGTSFITSLLIDKWKYKHEKRIEGEYGHYKQLNQALYELQAMFKEAKCDDNNNPFCLLYKAEVIVGNGNLRIPFEFETSCISAFRPISEKINKLLNEQDANVNPARVSMTEWTCWQTVLGEFTKMILEKWNVGTVDANTKIHIMKWKALSEAVDKLQAATDFTSR